MGRGNHYFRLDGQRPFPTYYIEYPEFDEEDPEMHTIECDYIKENLMCVSGLTIVDKWAHDRDERILAENGILELRLADNEWSFAIGCVPKENEHGNTNPLFARSANRIMKEIAGMYDLHVRCSAWTSGLVENKTNYVYY